ncbi:MAG TPA: acetyltransferase [Candidatus Omnitrophota bacterium]|nr:acetyltransferase [Candidatus Omnitrophota bacterium]
MKDKVLLIGGGGHCRVVIDAIKSSGQYEIAGITDPLFTKGESVDGVPVLGRDEDLQALFDQGYRYAFICVGSVVDNKTRQSLFQDVQRIGFGFPNVIHPSAVVSGNAQLGRGVFIAAGVIIGPGSRIGNNAIINTTSSVDHDCVIEDHVHVAPGVTLCGGVFIGQGSLIGPGSTVIVGKRIAPGCLIGAGATVVDDCKEAGTYWGTPARRKGAVSDIASIIQ